MKAKNTMGKREFIFYNAFWGVIQIIWYHSLLFISMPNLTYEESKYIMWIMVLISVVIGGVFCYKQMRSYRNAFLNTFFSLGIYSMISYYPFFQEEVIVLLIVILLALIVFILSVFTRKVRSRKGKFHILKNRLRHVFVGTRIISSFVMAILMIPLGVKSILGIPIFEVVEPAVQYVYSEEYTIAHNIDVVKKLDKSIWETLTLQEKLDVMQVIANIERNYLGIVHELNVKSTELGDSTLGYYNDTGHVIMLDINFLANGSSLDVLDTLCHEAYHAYQYRQLDAFNQLDEEGQNLLMFYEIREYKEEFEGGYVDADEDFFQYYMQECEWQARKYAEEAVFDYLEKIY